MKKIIYSFLVIIFCSEMVIAKSGKPHNTVDKSGWYQVTAKPSLSVRKKPSVTAKKKGSIPTNGKVKVIKLANKRDFIGGYKGQWVKIQWKKGSGYVFDAFLIKIQKKKSKMVIVPDIEKGCPFEIEEILQPLGLIEKRIPIHGPDDHDSSGISCAYRQSPKAGTKVKRGTVVTYRAWWEAS